MRRVVGFGAAVAVAACQLVFPVDDFSGGARPASTDAEAQADTAVPEAAPQDSAPSPFCATRAPGAVFCADFDEGTLLAGWSSTSAVPGSTIDLDPDASFSPPASLVASLPDGQGSTRVYRTLDQTLSFVHVELDLRVDVFDPSADPNAAFCPFAIDLDSGHELRLVTGRLRTYLEEVQSGDGGAQVFQGYDFATTLPVSTWVHVVLEIDTAASPPTARASSNGAPSVTAELDRSWRAGAPVVMAGAIFAVNSGSPWRGHLDDIVVSGH
jgi:hypothetical protein